MCEIEQDYNINRLFDRVFEGGGGGELADFDKSYGFHEIWD